MNLKLLNKARDLPFLYRPWVFVRDIRSLMIGLITGSFSQHNEDKFIMEFFAGRRSGIYLDIGASHPFRISNTYLLYRAGWHGITVEPIPSLCRLHRKWRPRDLLLPVAVSPKDSHQIPFYEMTPSVLSTLSEEIARDYMVAGRAVINRIYNINAVRIQEVIQRATALGRVAFLSIDIEGLDTDILSAIDLHSFRPELICIEFNNMQSRGLIEESLRKFNYCVIAEFGCNLFATPNVNDAVRSECPENNQPALV